jgi:hypothetical protein
MKSFGIMEHINNFTSLHFHYIPNSSKAATVCHAHNPTMMTSIQDTCPSSTWAMENTILANRIYTVIFTIRVDFYALN